MGDEARKSRGVELAWAVWSRRKWLGILVFAAPFSAAVALVTFLPSIYRSTTTVVVERQQVPEAFVRSTVTGGVETRLQTISQESLSRSRLEGLITRFGLYPDLRDRVPPEELIERMRRDIQLVPKRVNQRGRGGATIAFSLSYMGSDPRTVVLVANTLASFFIEENLKVREQQATGTAEFLRSQLGEAAQRLAEQEGRVSEFKKRYIGELPQQMAANLATLERLNGALQLNSGNLTRANERRAALAKQLAGPDGFGAAGGPDATAARIARLNQELAELRTRFTDKYPDVVRVKSEIAALERQLAEAKIDREGQKETAAPVSPGILRLRQEISAVEAEITVLKTGEQNLRRDIAVYQRRVENTPRREQEFEELSRDYETRRQLYRSLLTRHEESQLSESMEQHQKGEQFRILDPAIASQQQAAPNRIRLILIGLMLSLGLAVGAVTLAEYLDTSFHTVDDLRTFSKVPVLVSIPRIVTAADARRRRWQFRLAAVSAMLALALIVGASYFIAHGNEKLVRLLPGGLS